MRTVLVGVADRPNRGGDCPTVSLPALTHNTLSGVVDLSCIEPNEVNMLDMQNPPSGGAKRKQEGRRAWEI
jgi:hypothetical protein